MIDRARCKERETEKERERKRVREREEGEGKREGPVTTADLCRFRVYVVKDGALRTHNATILPIYHLQRKEEREVARERRCPMRNINNIGRKRELQNGSVPSNK